MLTSNTATYDMVLADGSRWVIAGGDEQASSIVSYFVGAMKLRSIGPSLSLPQAMLRTARATELPRDTSVRRLLVSVDRQNPEISPSTPYRLLPSEEYGFFVCILHPYDNSDGLYVQLMHLSLLIVRDAQNRGGVLLHGALAERDGIGVILAAPGGTGKTTASGRLPSPWKSLCDDMTLVVRDAQGHYWAHPWPTWSRFLWGGSGGSWDVQHAVPLKSIFFLDQATEDRVQRVGPGQAVSLLVECAQQASILMTRGLSNEEKRSLHMEWFDNICALTQVIPTHLLHISLTGTFWQEMERVLLGNNGVAM